MACAAENCWANWAKWCYKPEGHLAYSWESEAPSDVDNIRTCRPLYNRPNHAPLIYYCVKWTWRERFHDVSNCTKLPYSTFFVRGCYSNHSPTSSRVHRPFPSQRLLSQMLFLGAQFWRFYYVLLTGHNNIHFQDTSFCTIQHRLSCQHFHSCRFLHCCRGPWSG